jgi:hypothetical protein
MSGSNAPKRRFCGVENRAGAVRDLVGVDGADRRERVCAWRGELRAIGTRCRRQTSRTSASADLGPPSAMLIFPKMPPGWMTVSVRAVRGVDHGIDPAGDHQDQGVARTTRKH